MLPQMEQHALYDGFNQWQKGAVDPAVCSSDGTTNGWNTGLAANLKQRVGSYVCPSDTTEPYTPAGTYAIGSYAFNHGTNGPSLGTDQVRLKHHNTGVFMYRTKITPASVTDGLSNTFFVGEVYKGDDPNNSNRWLVGSRHTDSLRSTENPINTKPTKGVILDLYGNKVNGAFMSLHRGGAQFVYGDGHVVFISENIDLITYRAMATRSGGEAIATR